MFKEKIKINDVIQYIFMILGIFLCIKKGGFFTYDCIMYILLILGLSIVYIFNNYNKIKESWSKNKKSFLVLILFMLLAFCYSLPIIFKKVSYMNDGIYEMLRYLALFPIFLMSERKSINLLIIFGIIQSILGIDGIANRYFKSILYYFNSGYLSKDLDRLSGTIQYANTTGIIILTSLIFLFTKLKNYILNDNKLKIYLSYIFEFIFITAIILTKSRMVILLLISSLIIMFFKENKFLKMSILINLGLSFLASNNITNLLSKNKGNIYFTIICYIILSYIVIRKLFKYYDKINNLNIKSIVNIGRLNNKKYIYVFLAATFIFVCFLFCILNNNGVDISENSKIEREIYNLKENNLLNIEYKISDNSESILKIFEEDKNFNRNEIYNEKLNNIKLKNVEYNYKKKEDIKKIIIEVKNIKGKITVNSISNNNKKVKINYILLPSEFMFRIKEAFHGSTTIRDRIEYNKDAIKLWGNSKIIGLGGEAFRHNYKKVQELKYNSTEVHNSFMQILLESGILGFICIVSIIIITMITKSEFYYKLSYILLIFHSIFDLNFSYMIVLVIFTIITKIIISKENICEKR